jgi:hypothetical protein
MMRLPSIEPEAGGPDQAITTGIERAARGRRQAASPRVAR